MKLIKLNKYAVIFLTMILWSTLPQADMPAWYPDGFEIIGQVDSINTRRIVIGDIPLFISPTFKVSSIQKKKDYLSSVKKGSYVGVNTLKIKNKEYADHIWLFPSDQLEFMTLPGNE